MIDVNVASSRPAVSFLPTTAVLEMTYRCDHACLFCSCPWSDEGGDFKKGRELDAREWKEVLRTVSSLGVAQLCFTGGEALLREDLWEIIAFARSLKDAKIVERGKKLALKREPFRLYLISNGAHVDDRVLKLCKKYRVQLSMSLPGLKTFPELTGGGDPDKVLRAFTLAKRMGLFTVVNVTVTRKNLPEFYETIAAGLLAGADQLLMNVFLKGGRGLRHAAELALSSEEIGQALEQAEQVLEEAGRFGSVGTELPKCLVPVREYKRLEVASRCSAATGFFVIGPSGYVRVCNHSPLDLVFYREIETLKNNDYWCRFTQKQYLPQRCLACPEMGRCDGGCREEAHIVAGAVDAVHELVSACDSVSAAPLKNGTGL